MAANPTSTALNGSDANSFCTDATNNCQTGAQREACANLEPPAEIPLALLGVTSGWTTGLLWSSLSPVACTSQSQNVCKPTLIDKSSYPADTDANLAFIEDAIEFLANTIDLTTWGQDLMCNLDAIKVKDDWIGWGAGYYNSYLNEIWLLYSELNHRNLGSLTLVIHELSHHLHLGGFMPNQVEEEFRQICWDSNYNQLPGIPNDAFFDGLPELKDLIVRDTIKLNPEKYGSKQLDPLKVDCPDRDYVNPSDFCLYGERSVGEDFATCLTIWVLAPSLFERAAEDNTYLTQKLEFFKRHFPRLQDITMGASETTTPAETESPLYKSENVAPTEQKFIDKANGKVWQLHKRGDGTYSAIQFDSTGAVDLIGVPFDTDKIYAGWLKDSFVKDGHLYSVGNPLSGQTLPRVACDIDLATGAIRLFEMPTLDEDEYLGDFLLYDTDRNLVYLQATDIGNLAVWNLNSQSVKFITNKLTSESAFGLASSPDYLFSLSNEGTDHVTAYDKTTEATFSIALPEEFLDSELDYTLITTHNKLLILGRHRVANDKAVAYLVDPVTKTAARIELDKLAHESLTAENAQIYTNWAGDAGTTAQFRLLNAAFVENSYQVNFTLQDLSIAPKGQELVNANSDAEPDTNYKLSIDSTTSETLPFNSDGQIVFDPEESVFYTISDKIEGCDDANNPLILITRNDTVSQDTFEVVLPDIFREKPLLFKNSTFAAHDGRLFLRANDSGKILDFELDTNNSYFVDCPESADPKKLREFYAIPDRMYFDKNTGHLYHLSISQKNVKISGLNDPEDIISLYSPDTGDQFDLPALPLSVEAPIDVLIDGDIFYILTDTWMHIYDAGQRAYVDVTPIRFSKTQIAIIHDGRPWLIEPQSNGWFEVTDLLSGSKSQSQTTAANTSEIWSDNRTLFLLDEQGRMTAWDAMKIDTLSE